MPIEILETTQPDFAERFARLREPRPDAESRREKQVRAILEAVRAEGDRALLRFAEEFDGTRLAPERLRVSVEELREAERQLSPKERAALKLAARRITGFHRKQFEQQRHKTWSVRDPAGLVLGEIVSPLRRVGVYVPGGQACYPSTALMNAIPARVAGVREIVLVTPPRKEGDHPAVLAAARLAGVTEVYRVGGAQAIAALAYGTETIRRVDKIVGPGNAWVQTAKRLVYGTVDIDKPAGPSEILVVADRRAPASFVAADLLAQAEHGSGDECAILLSPSRPLVEAVREEIRRQLPLLPRRKEIATVLRRRSALVVVRSLEEALSLAEEVSPEHLELLVEKPERLLPRLRNAGAIFLGPFSPAPLGDYLAGPNHVLPTGGAARFASPLGVSDFVKRTNLVAASAGGLAKLGPAVVTLAELESYAAHAGAIRSRLDSWNERNGKSARRAGKTKA
ncbi:MAG: histidinol dehydrogenase [Candidatus Binatia bacterium]|nr:MAG: histidinol dehydrogenase [Candidatus Binatia bacterium]